MKLLLLLLLLLLFWSGRAAGKLQSKVKARPRKGTSELAASAVPNTAVEKVAGLASTVLDNMLPVESSGVENGRLTDHVSEPNMESAGTKEPGRNNGQALLSPPEILATVFCQKDSKGKSSFPAQNFVDSSAFMKCNVVATDFSSPNEAAVQVDNGRLELEVNLQAFFKLYNFFLANMFWNNLVSFRNQGHFLAWKLQVSCPQMSWSLLWPHHQMFNLFLLKP